LATAGGADGSLRIWQWNQANNSYLQTQAINTTNGSSVDAVVLSDDESIIVAGFNNGSLLMMAITPAGQTYRISQLISNGHTGGVYSAAITSDDSKFVSTGADGTTAFWGRPSSLLPFNLNKRLTEVGYSIDIDRKN
jgi:WD40 repeat protein